MGAGRPIDRLGVAAPLALALVLAGLLLTTPTSSDRVEAPLEPPVEAPGSLPPPALTLAQILLPPPLWVSEPPAYGAGREAVSTEARGASPAAPAELLGTTASDLGAGRKILQAVADGTGPAITLTWPQAEPDRRRLAAHLVRCGGLVVALMAQGRLWRLAEPPGRFWHPRKRDRSPILRRVDAVAAEDDLASRIREHHGLKGGALVALVTRSFDRRLLGGLARALPSGLPRHGQISATYAVAGDRLFLADLRLDGRPVGGPIALGRSGVCD